MGERATDATHFIPASGSLTNMQYWLKNKYACGITQMVECSAKCRLSYITVPVAIKISLHRTNSNHCAKKPVTTMLTIPLEMYSFTL